LIPKVMEALWIWTQFPRQIASDLSEFHHRRIAEWHQGYMSSYELLELLEFMNDRGAFKTAARGGEWSKEEAIWTHVANELAKLRATLHVVHGGKEAAYAPMVFLSPSELREMAEKSEEQEGLREAVYSFASVDDLFELAGDIEGDL
jgi:hypothetical protein